MYWKPITERTGGVETISKHRAAATFMLILLAAAFFSAQNVMIFSEPQYPKPKGIQTVLVIPVEFTDRDPSVPLSSFQDILTRMNDYFKEVSYGKVFLETDILQEWVKLPHVMSHYGRDAEHPGDDRGGNSRGSLQLAYDAIEQVDESIDFSKYIHLILIHTGADQAEVSQDSTDDTIWSYSYWDIDIPTQDGVSVTRVSIVSESSPLGVWIHEYLHQLGELPDLWETGGGEEHYIGVWSPMDIGFTLGVPKGSSPPHLTAWSKIKLGWLEPVVLLRNDSTITIAPLENMVEVFDQTAMIPLPDGTYYLIEVRERVGFDSHLPGEGVLIYHVDELRGEPEVRVVLREDNDRLKAKAVYGVGDSFFDEFQNLYIDIVSKSFHGYQVKVSLGQERHIILEVPNKVSVLQPFTAKVKMLTTTVDPKLNLFLDGVLYKTSTDPVDGEYRIDVQFNLDQAGDHVIRVIVVDPVVGTRSEVAKRIYVEVPYTLLATIVGLTLIAAAFLIIFIVQRYRRGRRVVEEEF